MSQIIETIHHGDFRSVKSLELGTAAVSREHIAQVLANSPYNFNRFDDPAVVSKILAGLMMRGKAEHGWARYTVHNEY